MKMSSPRPHLEASYAQIMRAVRANPSEKEVLFELARCHHARKQFNAAKVVYQNLINQPFLFEEEKNGVKNYLVDIESDITLIYERPRLLLWVPLFIVSLAAGSTSLYALIDPLFRIRADGVFAGTTFGYGIAVAVALAGCFLSCWLIVLWIYNKIRSRSIARHWNSQVLEICAVCSLDTPSSFRHCPHCGTSQRRSIYLRVLEKWYRSAKKTWTIFSFRTRFNQFRFKERLSRFISRQSISRAMLTRRAGYVATGLCLVTILAIWIGWIVFSDPLKRTAYKIWEAVEDHDLEAFYEYVDLDTLLSRATRGIGAAEGLSYQTSYVESALLMGLVGLIEPTTTAILIDTIEQFIETGTPPPRDYDETDFTLPTYFTSAIELREMGKGKVEGKIGYLPLYCNHKRTNQTFEIILKMRCDREGKWKLIEIDDIYRTIKNIEKMSVALWQNASDREILEAHVTMINVSAVFNSSDLLPKNWSM